VIKAIIAARRKAASFMGGQPARSAAIIGKVYRLDAAVIDRGHAAS